MIIDALIKWYAEKWVKEHFTEKNIKAGAEAVFEWLADSNIQQALFEIFKFCLKGIIKEIKEQHNERE